MAFRNSFLDNKIRSSVVYLSPSCKGRRRPHVRGDNSIFELLLCNLILSLIFLPILLILYQMIPLRLATLREK